MLTFIYRIFDNYLLMHRILFILLFSVAALAGRAQNYRPVDEGSKVHFTIKNFGINTGGDFTGLKGDISFDPVNPAAAVFAVSVDVNTIDTDSRNRDEHLVSDSYFDAAKYPVIQLRSTKVSAANNGMYYFTGTLTMHGVSKNISFPFSATQQGSGYLFTGNFEVNRLDYSVGGPSAVLGDVVKVSLSVLARKG